MLYCPFCGAIVKNNEQYCISCGEQLPDDISNREQIKKTFNFFWFIPIISFIIVSMTIGVYYMILQNKTQDAIALYEQGTKNLKDHEVTVAQQKFAESIELKETFQAADIALSFIKHSAQVEDDLDDATTHLADNDFEEALLLVNEAEGSVKDYHGEPVIQLIDKIINVRSNIKLAEVQHKLENEPNIDDLKNLLWDTESIKTDDANEVAEEIQTKIINFIFSKASEELNDNQFSDAHILVEDGLKYASDSEKLLSLKTTIEKEKTAFETAQEQRIEQAINMAAEEHEVNQSDAIKLNSIKLKKDDQDKLVVKGEVSSIATIPIHSVVIEYTLMTENEDEILSNKVFVYPEKLYPNELGNFEYTHYEIDDLKNKNIEVEVNKITWYTD